MRRAISFLVALPLLLVLAVHDGARAEPSRAPAVQGADFLVPEGWRVDTASQDALSATYALAPDLNAMGGIVAHPLPAGAPAGALRDAFLDEVLARLLVDGEVVSTEPAGDGGWQDRIVATGLTRWHGGPAERSTAEILYGESGGVGYVAFTLGATAGAWDIAPPLETIRASFALPAKVDAGAAGEPSEWQPPTEEVLFDGTLAPDWIGYSAAGGRFDAHARTGEDGLVVDVPAGSAWGRAGITSPGALVWLDRFGAGSEVSVTFEIDASRSTGFALALAAPGYGGVMGNGPGSPGVEVDFRPDPAQPDRAGLEVHVNPHREGDFFATSVRLEAPARVTIALRPGQVSVSAPGWPDRIFTFADAADGQGFRIYAFSLPSDVQQAARFALRRITLSRTLGEAPVAPAPADGVADFETEIMFDGAPGEAWEPIGLAGGDFASFARYAGGALVVDVPANKSWGKTGLLSAAPFLVPDETIADAPWRVTIRTDPDRTSGFVFALTNDKTAEAWPVHALWTGVIAQADGRRRLSLHYTPYQEWSRLLPAAWDGELEIEVTQGGATVATSDGVKIRGAGLPFHSGGRYYATVVAHPFDRDQPVSLALLSIERKRVPPPGMLATERWRYLPDAAFDPAGFLGDLERELGLGRQGSIDIPRVILVQAASEPQPDPVARKLANLNAYKLEALLKAIGKGAKAGVPDGFYYCLCASYPRGGHVGVSYRPEIGRCHFGGLGEWTAPLPGDPAVWESCMRQNAYADGSTIADTVRDAIASGQAATVAGLTVPTQEARDRLVKLYLYGMLAEIDYESRGSVGRWFKDYDQKIKAALCLAMGAAGGPATVWEAGWVVGYCLAQAARRAATAADQQTIIDLFKGNDVLVNALDVVYTAEDWAKVDRMTNEERLRWFETRGQALTGGWGVYRDAFSPIDGDPARGAKHAEAMTRRWGHGGMPALVTVGTWNERYGASWTANSGKGGQLSLPAYIMLRLWQLHQTEKSL